MDDLPEFFHKELVELQHTVCDESYQVEVFIKDLYIGNRVLIKPEVVFSKNRIYEASFIINTTFLNETTIDFKLFTNKEDQFVHVDPLSRRHFLFKICKLEPFSYTETKLTYRLKFNINSRIKDSNIFVLSVIAQGKTANKTNVLYTTRPFGIIQQSVYNDHPLYQKLIKLAEEIDDKLIKF